MFIVRAHFGNLESVQAFEKQLPAGVKSFFSDPTI
jgi:hypothetical protein